MNYQIQGLSIHAEVHVTAEPAAATSIDAFPAPVEAMSLRLGRRSMMLRGSGGRSRMTQMTSKGSKRLIMVSGSAMWS
jgi:hypothetical protein